MMRGTGIMQGGPVDDEAVRDVVTVKGDKGDKGDPGDDAAPVDMDAVREEIEAQVQSQLPGLIPPPVKGDKGDAGPGPDPELVASMIGSSVAQQLPALVPQPVKGDKGDEGPAPTGAQIAAAVASYVAEHPPAAGANATDSQVAAAVATYLAANPPARGQAGPAWSPTDLGTITLVDNAIVLLALGPRSKSFTGITGLLATDKVLVFAEGALPAGYHIQSTARVTGAGALTVTFTGPVLAIGASNSMVLRLVALR